MKYETRLNDENQVLIPSYLVKKYNLETGDVVEWTEIDDKIIINFKKSGS